jgi:DNA-binding PadR family transcriptional regulator
MGRFGPPVRRNRGDVRVAALLLLAEGPMHGYQIIREVAERSGGTWRLSPGAVYPTLSQLEADGLVTSTAGDGRSVYALTDAGRAEAEQLASVTPPWESSATDVDELREAVMAVVAAARQVAAIGTDEQRQSAVAALTETRRALYRLLADDPG